MDGNGISTLFVPLPHQPAAQAPMPIPEATPPRPVEAAERPAPQGGHEKNGTGEPEGGTEEDRLRSASEGKGLRLDCRV